MHIVNMKAVHPNLTAALDDPTGLAVLGFFIDVGSNKPFDACQHLHAVASCMFNAASPPFFSLFSQVVYADNVHFGHISQKLSSVAYKG